jgi:hypothetical protein
MDIQFTIFDYTDLCAGAQPPVLVEYAKELRQLCAYVLTMAFELDAHSI